MRCIGKIARFQPQNGRNRAVSIPRHGFQCSMAQTMALKRLPGNLLAQKLVRLHHRASCPSQTSGRPICRCSVSGRATANGYRSSGLLTGQSEGQPGYRNGAPQQSRQSQVSGQPRRCPSSGAERATETPSRIAESGDPKSPTDAPPRQPPFSFFRPSSCGILPHLEPLTEKAGAMGGGGRNASRATTGNAWASHSHTMPTCPNWPRGSRHGKPPTPSRPRRSATGRSVRPPRSRSRPASASGRRRPA